MRNTLSVDLKIYTRDGTNYAVVEVCVDGIPLTDFSYYATDLKELTRSMDADGEFFILTCWCGVPECTGIRRGVLVRHHAGQIHWHVSSPLPQREFVFEEAGLQATLLAFNKQRRRFVAERTYSDKTPYQITPMQNEPFFTL